ncbi:MAG: NAD(P)-dependent oxidoreductase [Acidiferrobacterales bacterium]|nr:NAD(P)-dependent oxidoreductase [Acidiferrobacterales bacterium]
MKIGFVGLGNVGGKLAGSLLRNGFDLTIRELDQDAAQPFLNDGAAWSETPAELAASVDVVITCLPSPVVCRSVMEGPAGVLAGLRPGSIWAEMSTTDHTEVVRLGQMVREVDADPIDCPVSGGCHRAASGNISIFAGCDRPVFDRVLVVLKTMGRQILHTGPLGTASVLKVMTNYLATANLVTLCEALVTADQAGLDLATTYEAIRISSGNSFVHETESQVILNGSRNINFTMDLVVKDITLFHEVAERAGVKLEISPKLIEIFKDGMERYGPREWSPNIIRRLEEQCSTTVHAPGFPAEMSDDEKDAPGFEVTASRSDTA